jgi:dTMP kinase
MTPPEESRRGVLIALEGGEGCGKSTQVALLGAALGAVVTREPGGTAAGERIRSLFLDRSIGELGAVAELLLVAAARAEHVRLVIGPALDEGRVVVTDRYSGSSLAYQGYGRGLPLSTVVAVSSAATGGIEPDLNILLDLPDEVAEARRCGSPDRIEAAEAGFHARVTAGFRQLATADPDRWALVDALGTIEEVAARVQAAVSERLGDLAVLPR